MKNERQIARVIISNNIKRYRTRLKITQDEAAERANITNKYWQRLEMKSQIDMPSIEVLFKIAKALQIKPYKLLQE